MSLINRRSATIGAIILVAYFTLIPFSCRQRDTLRSRSSDSTANGEDKIPPVVGLSKIATSHIFFENSGSMDGYLTGQHDIKVVLSRLAYALENKSDHQRFYFYNTMPYPLPNGTTTSEFINKLTPNGIKIGDVSRSNLNAILEGILNAIEDNDVGILVTDGIYSMDASSGNILGQLQVSSEGTYHEFRKRLAKSNLQTAAIKLSSQFNGPYYPADGGGIDLNQKRPYYIWLFGSPERIGQIKDDFQISERPGYLNHAIFQLTSDDPPYYSVNSTYKVIGSFKPVRDSNSEGRTTAIEDAERRRNEFQFSVGVDMSGIPVEENYLLDLRNYEVNNPDYTVNEISKASTLTGRDAYGLDKSTTHLITLSTKRHPRADIKISLSNNLPQWISDTSTEDDSYIKGDSLKTFGFKYLIGGIVRAYQSQSSSKEYFQLDVSIND